MMRSTLMAATALSMAFAAPVAAQSYSGGTGSFTGLGANTSEYPDTEFDIVDFAPISGTYTAFGSYALNTVTFTVGINRNTPAPFSGTFTLSGLFDGNAFSYDVDYTGLIDASDTITLGGNFINFGGTQAYLNPLTLAGAPGGSYTGTLTFATAVPEPASWGLMILGVGAIGATMRRRNVATTVRYA